MDQDDMIKTAISAAIGAAVCVIVTQVCNSTFKKVYHLQCPHCGRQYDIDENQYNNVRGQTIPCNCCNQPVKFPALIA